jgi:hypothetical protein
VGFFSRVVKIAGSFRTTKTTNKKTGKTSTSVKRVKPKSTTTKRKKK